MRRIGVDIGGTKIACAAFDGAGNIIHEARIATPRDYDGIVSAVAQLVKEAGEGTVGIGSPGSQGPQDGLWRNSNIVACNGRTFHGDLEKAIGRTIRSENDANCFALSEAREGAGQGGGSGEGRGDPRGTAEAWRYQTGSGIQGD